MHLDAGCCLAPVEEGCTFVFRWMGPCARAHVFIHAECACESTRMCRKCPVHRPHENSVKRSRFPFFFPSVFVSCILQRGKMLKCYKALTCNIPCKGEVGGKWIRAGSRFCFLLRASLQNAGDSPARKPLRQAHRSLCNVSPCPHSTGGGGAGMVEAGGECQIGQATRVYVGTKHSKKGRGSCSI